MVYSISLCCGSLLYLCVYIHINAYASMLLTLWITKYDMRVAGCCYCCRSYDICCGAWNYYVFICIMGISTNEKHWRTM